MYTHSSNPIQPNFVRALNAHAHFKSKLPKLAIYFIMFPSFRILSSKFHVSMTHTSIPNPHTFSHPFIHPNGQPAFTAPSPPYTPSSNQSSH
ncbi:uncharacterized protein EAF01_000785 [Botrytis porri]|uniref:uncharacterized protein n=1 Tax=Botrytis porri TaxID=87229 RepID=UPI001900CF9B|nr:uncharacterized protein EAF01_000785 [Botrytis porri]KAF7914379.1 hypothetical protein EAF01_000785 [Botrytis porri]